MEGAVRIGNVLRVAAAILDDLIHLRLANARGNRIGRLRHLCGTGGNQSSTAIAGVCVICASRCMTGLAHMTAHGAQGDQQLRQHFGTVAASHAVVVQNHDLVALCHNLSQLGDLLRLHAADRLCPFRRLRRTVVLAKDVVLKTTLTRNLAADITLFNGRLTVTPEIYWNTTKDWFSSMVLSSGMLESKPTVYLWMKSQSMMPPFSSSRRSIS